MKDSLTAASKQQKQKRIGTYADPTTDAGFKAIFCDIANKEVIVDLLNIFLPRKIAGVVTPSPSEMHADQVTGKGIRVDLHCVDETGAHFIVEMQLRAQNDFAKRITYYAAMTYVQQIKTGGDYINLKPVYQISFVCEDMGFDRSDESWDGRFISDYTMREKLTHENLDETIFCILVELNRFHKTMEECTTEEDFLLWTLKNIGKLDKVPANLRKSRPIVQLLDVAEVARFNDQKYNEYINDMRTEADYRAEMKAQLEKGIAEGHAKGIAEGEARKSAEIALKLKSMGMSPAEISSVTGMPENEVNKL